MPNKTIESNQHQRALLNFGLISNKPLLLSILRLISTLYSVKQLESRVKSDQSFNQSSPTPRGREDISHKLYASTSYPLSVGIEHKSSRLHSLAPQKSTQSQPIQQNCNSYSSTPAGRCTRSKFKYSQRNRKPRGIKKLTCCQASSASPPHPVPWTQTWRPRLLSHPPPAQIWRQTAARPVRGSEGERSASGSKSPPWQTRDTQFDDSEERKNSSRRTEIQKRKMRSFCSSLARAQRGVGPSGDCRCDSAVRMLPVHPAVKSLGHTRSPHRLCNAATDMWGQVCLVY